MGVQIDAVAIFLGGDGTDGDSLNIYERDDVSKKEELSRDKVVEWQEVVAPRRQQYPICPIWKAEETPLPSFLFFFISVLLFWGWAAYFSLEEHLGAHFSRQNAVNPFLPVLFPPLSDKLITPKPPNPKALPRHQTSPFKLGVPN